MTYEQFGKPRNYTGVLSFWKVGSSDYNEWLMDNQTGLYYEVLMLEDEGYRWEDPIAEISVYVYKRFPDVPEGRWDYPYIGKISAVGIMTGMGNGEFNSTGTLARAQFAMTLYRMSGSPDVEYSAKFKDIADGDGIQRLFYGQVRQEWRMDMRMATLAFQTTLTENRWQL